ncbi:MULTISPECIES: hypothetical protein [unclassified Caballeronia]|uniref:hypothetical protein n=1 Tax=unclassified Caballeronia TaxID=2646786 RepID=UPI002860827E|nr:MULTISPECIES: hypothetical protein [unclassified Caballeronia]MDR5774060.1 hypothetical protein [Caballeronia sp. LZ002]MDR5849495.1 hypothetical protein [Caballeronia sp. LZ003]
MDLKPEKKPMPLWAIWLIVIVGVLAWCGAHPEDEDGSLPVWPAKAGGACSEAEWKCKGQRELS